MASRRIEDLHPELRKLYYAFDAKMREAKIPYIVTCTARCIVEQMALFCQGRLALLDVNRVRIAAGLAPLLDVVQNSKVTWTLSSKHVTNHYDKDLNNNFARAFDIAITQGKMPTWNLKVDVNQSGTPDYDEAGAIGESVGLVWGGRFKNPDRPHFELKEGG